ncbi:zinc finger protein 726-like [Diabrotica virgifera virgifera]|uniref:C2H2-type domain-containing protein n=1 Tax=Diabrotica virgifera virgifera TaxID=50390 RepID=A0ABM5KC71_DIAVI|nr:zinc finger protein 726-like [Diabrotica virgifera virgifera]
MSLPQEQNQPFSKEQCESKNKMGKDNISLIDGITDVKIKIEEDMEIPYNYSMQLNTSVNSEDFKIGHTESSDQVKSESPEIKQEYKEAGFALDKIKYVDPSNNQSDGFRITKESIKVEIKQEYEQCDLFPEELNIHNAHLNSEVKLEDFVKLEKLPKRKIKPTNRRKKLKDYSYFTRKWCSWLNLRKNRNRIHSCSLCGQTCIKPSILMFHYKVYHCTKKETQKKTQNKSSSMLHGLVKKENDQMLTNGSSYEGNYIFDTSEKPNSEEVNLKNFINTNQLNSYFSNGKKVFECHVCFKSFLRISHLTRHQRVHSEQKPFQCEICGSRFKKEDQMTMHQKVTHLGIRRYKCLVCLKQFAYPSTLKEHMLLHTGETYKCDICSKEFTTKKYLEYHIFGHNKEKPFKCEVCPKEFNFKKLLKRHMFVHAEEKPFACEVCPKKFSSKGSLWQHRLLHAEKRFKCSVCLKEFATSGNYKQHFLKYSEHRLLQCEFCSKNFVGKSEMKRHLQTHTRDKRLQCEVCFKRFSVISTFKTHMILHEDEDRFKCDVCQKKMTSQRGLKGHMRIHTGEKPYECNICFRPFTNHSSMMTHRKIHTDKIMIPSVQKKAANFMELYF